MFSPERKKCKRVVGGGYLVRSIDLSHIKTFDPAHHSAWPADSRRRFHESGTVHRVLQGSVSAYTAWPCQLQDRVPALRGVGCARGALIGNPKRAL
jgi:hypothetical protein